MAQSYGPVYIHIVFSTKHRENLLSKELHTEFARFITPKEEFEEMLKAAGIEYDPKYFLKDNV